MKQEASRAELEAICSFKMPVDFQDFVALYPTRQNSSRPLLQEPQTLADNELPGASGAFFYKMKGSRL
jgi:hypothetical protein